MNIFKVEDKIQEFHREFSVEGNFVLPANLRPFKVLLIAILSFVKIFTRPKVDTIIDEIIEAFNIID